MSATFVSKRNAARAELHAMRATATRETAPMTAPSWVSPGSRLFLVVYEGADGKAYALALSDLDLAHRISRLRGGEVIDTAVDRHADFALDAESDPAESAGG